MNEMLWLRVPIRHLNWVAKRGDATLKVYVAILRCVEVFTTTSEEADNSIALRHAGTCCVSTRYLVEKSGVERSNLRRVLTALKEAGIIEIQAPTLAPTQDPNPPCTIRLLSQSIWTREKGNDPPSPPPSPPNPKKKTQNKNSEKTVGAILAPPGDGGLRLRVKGGYFEITEGYIEELKKTFPNHRVEDELAAACQWAADVPERRKTARGAKRYLSGWVKRSAPARLGPAEIDCPYCREEKIAPIHNACTRCINSGIAPA